MSSGVTSVSARTRHFARTLGPQSASISAAVFEAAVVAASPSVP